ncbi:YbaK/EbsC family protein [Halovenus sp. WSH3]|uniref:YbaK/EbsC family protein n=1 Tax=Halovenus carboxidivorans TaxID=2692199 RepID=A0A6B0T016_9EURY|nr:YbaK/EbsC family protein [Halovenus carboxidivorans]MXR51304.1 YbaK/EbsC family protein [Halovenus carboxidivorans]
MSDADRFAECLHEQHGIDADIEHFPAGTETAADAAAAIGCDRAQIASSIALIADEMVVVVTSGANRVDTRKLATVRGVHTARMATPDEVEETLGYEVGGVPPFCHDTTVPVYLDETLTEYDAVWAAAGAPTAVFPIDPDDLLACADATAVDVVE